MVVSRRGKLIKLPKAELIRSYLTLVETQLKARLSPREKDIACIAILEYNGKIFLKEKRKLKEKYNYTNAALNYHLYNMEDKGVIVRNEDDHMIISPSIMVPTDINQILLTFKFVAE